MYRQIRLLRTALACLVVALPGSAAAAAITPRKDLKELPKAGSAPAVLWREPLDIKTRDLFYGPGGKEHMPSGKLTYIKEKLNGINPKFDVRDDNGVTWGVKFGIEAQPETAASRLVWAVGYFVDEMYYVAELPARRLPQLSRGENLIQHGKIQRVRLKRHNKGEHTVGFWGWDDNPFAGTKEMNGLKIMQEIICNTDLKAEHRIIVDKDGTEQHYMLKDLGGSFGKAGLLFMRTKGRLKDYQALPLIKSAGPDYVDFHYFNHIPRADAKWIGGYLGQLSESQLKDAFRAGGFTPEEIDGFAKQVWDKINELNSL